MHGSQRIIVWLGVSLIAWLLCLGFLAIGLAAATSAPSFYAARTFSLVPMGENILGGVSSIALGDFNGDGLADIAAPFSSSAISVTLANSDGTFGAPTKFSVGSFPEAVLARDLNGDGKLDLAVVNSNNNPHVSILIGNGLGGFGAASGFNAGVGANSMGIADFNHDGRLDLVTGNSGSSNVSLLLGNGSGQFASPVNTSVGPNPSAVVAGDFNGDLIPDLAVTSFNSGLVQVLLNDGSGGFLAPNNIAVGINPIAALAEYQQRFSAVVTHFNSECQ